MTSADVLLKKMKPVIHLLDIKLCVSDQGLMDCIGVKEKPTNHLSQSYCTPVSENNLLAMQTNREHFEVFCIGLT